jgi:predicted nucleic acid-binding protein
MNIAVTDACIFIGLREVDLFHQFFQLDFEIHSSLDVVNELFDDQRKMLSEYVKEGKFRIHSISELDRIDIQQTHFPAALSEADKTVLFLASKLNAIVVSSDNVVRKYAKKQGMEFHGILWIVDQLFETRIISRQEACEKLEQLIRYNIFYQNNADLVSEIQRRLKSWRS